MKISILPAAALCATLAAIVLMPVHPAAASIALTSTGILCLFAAGSVGARRAPPRNPRGLTPRRAARRRTAAQARRR